MTKTHTVTTTSTIYLIQRWHVGDTWRNFGGHYPRKSSAQIALSIITNTRPGRYRIIPATMTITIPPSKTTETSQGDHGQ